MKLSEQTYLDFDDVLIKPQRTTLKSRQDVNIERDFYFYHSPKRWVGTPIICANMGCTGTMEMGKALAKHKMVTCLHKYYSAGELKEFFDENPECTEYVLPTIGMSEDELNTLLALSSYDINVCIDIANGYIEKFVGFCARVRSKFPNAIIMAGNVASGEMVQELILHGGVDIVKIGIGPGKACTTRNITGCGVPQLSAIADCSHAAHGLKSSSKHLGLICGDGGCKTSGDVCKALCAGADFVMMGGMFAGTDECEGEWDYDLSLGLYSSVENIKGETVWVRQTDDFSDVIYAPKTKLKFYGMSSHYAQERHSVGKKDYRASEGEVNWVDYKGPVDNTVQEILGGIRSCCTYIGSDCIKDMSKCAEFIKVNRIK